MKLIINSIICGFLSLTLSTIIFLNIGGQAAIVDIIFFALIGFLSPGFYVLDQLYKSNNSSNKIKFDVDVSSTLDTLKTNGILTDDEYGKSLYNLNLVDERNENLRKYDESVKVIFYLFQKNIILENEDEYNKKIILLKHLYKQI